MHPSHSVLLRISSAVPVVWRKHSVMQVRDLVYRNGCCRSRKKNLYKSGFSKKAKLIEWIWFISVVSRPWSDYFNNGCLQKGSPRTQSCSSPETGCVSHGLQSTPESQRSRFQCQRRKERASKREGKQAKSKGFLLPCPLCRLSPEGVGHIFGGFPHLKWFSQEKSPHRCTPQLRF